MTMFNIRSATDSDISEVARMAYAFAAHAIPMQGIDPDVFSKYVCISMADDLLLVAEDEDGTLVGMIAAVRVQHTFNPTKTIIMELCWWVDEEHRNSSVGARLLKALKNKAKTGEMIQMSILHNSGVKESSLERLGYTKFQTTFTLEV